jgi:hypothetical protein
MDLACQSRNKTPSNNEKAEVDGRASDMVEEQVGWNLHKDIGDE